MPKGPLLAAPRPFQAEEQHYKSDIRLLGDLQGVIYFDPEVPHSALQLCVT